MLQSKSEALRLNYLLKNAVTIFLIAVDICLNAFMDQLEHSNGYVTHITRFLCSAKGNYLQGSLTRQMVFQHMHHFDTSSSFSPMQ